MRYIFTTIFLLISMSLFSQPQIISLNVNEIRGLDTTQGGCSDYDSVFVRTQGVVYGKNFGLANGRIQLSLVEKRADTLLSNRCGIGLFKSTLSIGVTLNEGDSVRVIGMVNCFNGLSQIVIDTIKILKTNCQLTQPRVVTDLSEVSESYLVKMQNLEFLPNSWPAVPSGSGFTAKAFRGVAGTTDYQEFDVRIDNDCDLFGAPVPTGKVDVVGMGGQFDSSIPRDSRYQLLPRSSADITPSAPLEIPVISFADTNYVIEEGTVLSMPLNSTVPVNQQIACLISVQNVDTDSADFILQQPALATFPIGTTTTSFGITINNDDQAEGYEKFYLKLKKTSDNYNLGADSICTIVIPGILSSKKLNDVRSYFYYQNGTLRTNFPSNFAGEVYIYNSFGQLVIRTNNNNVNQDLDKIRTKPSGVYRAMVRSGDKVVVTNFVK